MSPYRLTPIAAAAAPSIPMFRTNADLFFHRDAERVFDLTPMGAGACATTPDQQN
jgi:hypothetical protein